MGSLGSLSLFNYYRYICIMTTITDIESTVDLTTLRRSECCGAKVFSKRCSSCKIECDWTYDLDVCDTYPEILNK